ncbi:MAG: hypothetical protein II055_06265 [Prevotella sp.]|nr:hypothetical protein [Prevotella sp.]
MKLRNICLLMVLCLSVSAMAQSTYDLQKPFGFCTVSSRTDKTSTYSITGGGCYTYHVTGVSSSKVITLTSSGQDMKSAIKNAIDNYSVIIFDGSNGDFKVSSNIGLSNTKNKTLIGINNAKLVTTWYATAEIIKALNDAGVPEMSTSGGGGTLPNGQYVAEEAEYYTRKIIIEKTGDNSEKYRSSGVFSFNGCQNIIIRNLTFQGPGSIDVGGSDLISFSGGTKNCWVDHCDFMDGMDGNFDITQSSDFNTVSWCTFSYTSRSYMHQNTNLIGSSDSESKNYLNTTFAFNHWGKGCKARMPMARVGKIHMLNNYYTCTSGGNCINPRKNSEFLIEGNYFDQGVKSIYGESGAVAVTWKNTNYSVEGKSGESKGSAVTVPYTYSVAEYSIVPTEVSTYAGATLFNSEGGGGGDDPTPTPPPGGDNDTPSLVDGNSYVVGNGETISDGKKVECDDITMTYGNDGAWTVGERTEMADEGFSYLVGGNNNPKDANNKNYSSSKKVPTTGTYYVFSPTADGTLYVASYIFTNKNVYVTEDGVAISFSINGTDYESGDIINSSAETDGYVKFNVTSGKEYYLFGEATKIKVYGFNFVVDGATAISTVNENKDVKENRNGVTYNLAGQVVDSSYRGLVIINNKVVMR